MTILAPLPRHPHMVARIHMRRGVLFGGKPRCAFGGPGMYSVANPPNRGNTEGGPRLRAVEIYITPHLLQRVALCSTDMGYFCGMGIFGRAWISVCRYGLTFQRRYMA